MSTHSSILAWRIPWTEDPGRLQSTGSQSRTRLSDSHTQAHTHGVFQGLNNTVLCAQSFQSQPTLCDPVNSSPPGSSVHGILQARILEWLPRPFPGYLLNLGIEPASACISEIAGGFFTYWAILEALISTLLALNGHISLVSSGLWSYSSFGCFLWPWLF